MYKNLVENTYSNATSGLNEGWLIEPSLRWFNHINQLNEPLKTTYLVVVLHNQVFNGGFDQYFVNGYGQFADITIESLIKIKAFSRSELLKKALATCKPDNMEINEFRLLLIKRQLNDLFNSDKLTVQLDKLDIEYYQIKNEEILDLLGKFILSH